jgi:hypothetical protein
VGSVFQEMISSGQRLISKSAGVSVIYSDGMNWVRLIAVPGKTDFQLSDDFGAISQFRSRDYLVEAADLILNEVVIEPQRGHTITEQIGDEIHTYEVSRPDGDEQPWRWSTTDHKRIRIHTKLKAVANA